MDLERIKQNLRLRSGRLKKTRKPVGQLNPPVQSSGFDHKKIPNGHVTEPTPPPTVDADGPRQEEHSLHVEHGNAVLPKIPQQDPVDDVQQHRPTLTHATSDPSLNPSGQDPPLRYGRSGMERPVRHQSQNPASKPPTVQRTMSETDSGVARDAESSDILDFDLRPPPPRPQPPPVEPLCESLFSSGHLNTLLRHPGSLARFTSFIAKYRPQYHPVLLRYLETQKVIKAVEYANAVAEGIPIPSFDEDDSGAPRLSSAATLDRSFEESSIAAFSLMANSALPMYITYNLVKTVTECLINEITGRQAFVTKDLVSGLSEVFCLTDPKQEDNPIIYASDEFYRLTGYGPDDVIGRNCRFLQGSKTNRESVARLKQSINRGEDTCETVLNYRRDGRPFINLLMIAPLHDDKGNVKYHIGAQVDVTKLVERGNGLDGFRRYLATHESKKRETEVRGSDMREVVEGFRKPKALAKLRELSEMFDLEESAVVRSHSRSTSASREEDDLSISGSRKAPRRVFGDSDYSSDDGSDEGDVEDGEHNAWRLGESGRSGLSGKLPGVYDSYLLVRPMPSLRIVFVSPKLRRRWGEIIQHPFVSHIAAPANTLDGLQESFRTGVPVSAKVNFMKKSGARRDGTRVRPGTEMDEVGPSRLCWISATPLLGSDDRIGVWMVVIVEKTKVPTRHRRDEGGEEKQNQDSKASRRSRPRKIEMPERGPPYQPALSRSGFKSKQTGVSEEMSRDPPKLGEPTETSPRARIPSSPKEERKATDEVEAVGRVSSQQQIGAEDERLVAEEDRGDPNSDHTLTSPADPFVESSAERKGEVCQPHAATQELENEQEISVQEEGHEEPLPKSNIMQADNGNETSWSVQDHDRASPVFDAPTDPGIEDDSSVFHSFSIDENTPKRLPHLEDTDDTPSQSRPGTSGHDASPSRYNGTHYMDYLRHPGSRQSSEYNRAISGSGFLSSKYYHEEGDFREEDDDEEAEMSDFQCSRSPYSVD